MNEDICYDAEIQSKVIIPRKEFEIALRIARKDLRFVTVTKLKKKILTH